MKRFAGGFLVAAVLVLACSGGLSRDAQAWCGENEAMVARVALNAGLMRQDAQFSDWKNTDSAGYERACATAFNARYVGPSPLSPSLQDRLSPSPGSS